MSDLPPISILMPVFNGAKYLAQAVESIRAQTFRDFEFIIVNDGSSDHSLPILQRFAKEDARLRIVSRPNTGIVGALNDGLAVAKGKYIARMDADDIALPDRLAIQFRYMEAHPEMVAIGSSVVMADPSGHPLKDYKACTDPQTLRHNIIEIKDIGLIHPTLMARRDVLERMGGYRPQYNLVEDFDLFFRLLDEGELGNVPEPLLIYRQHQASTNSKKHHLQRGLMLQCLAEHRQRWNLPALESPLALPQVAAPGAQNGMWALWAIEGGHPATALRHASLACLRSGFAPHARKCLNYVLHTLLHRHKPS
ncbi:MAG: glycosyltransferase [Verrucomicrobia bacterium]|nr:glycosyltransferase [Verrucomicrobiota bacterium]